MNRVCFAVVSLLILSNCVELTLVRAKLSPIGAPASPELVFNKKSAIGQSARFDPVARLAPDLASFGQLLQTEIYGVLPARSQTRVLEKKVLDPAAYSGKARLEEWQIEVEAGFGEDVSSMAGNRGEFTVVLLMPNRVTGQVPVIMMQTFCPSNATIPLPGVSGPERSFAGGGIVEGVATYIFGRYICTPPAEMILDHGYAIATHYPGELFPDNKEQGAAALLEMSTGYKDDETRWGSIAAWSWMFSRVVDALAEDGRFDPNASISFGHSRFGKSAMVAAAFDDRIDGVIAHQSGTGGASLSKGNLGETVAKITKSYPHWFASKFASYGERTDELAIDQHHLLALLAPRPVFLGNARRDVWSDPNGAFRAAQAASGAWEMRGVNGLEQDRLVPFKPEANLSFWIRPGTHGVTEEDWPAFLQFLDAHFGGTEASAIE